MTRRVIYEDSSYEGRIDSRPRIPILYGESLNHPVCFPLFELLARMRGDDLLVSPSWHGTTRTGLWRRGVTLPSPVREAFDRGFCQAHAGQERLDFEVAAQKLSDAGEHKRALRFYDRCLALDPHSLPLYEQAGAAALVLGELDTALRYFSEGAARDHFREHDFARAHRNLPPGCRCSLDARRPGTGVPGAWGVRTRRSGLHPRLGARPAPRGGKAGPLRRAESI